MADKTPREVNLGYAFARLEAALASPGPTAPAKQQAWRQVIFGMLEGWLRPGSRTPVADTPPWVSLEVAQGGFATGTYSAGGPLEAHELGWLEALGLPADGQARLALNLHFLGAEGQGELLERLHGGRYRLRQPEEGAWLVVAWLQAQGAHEAAWRLVEELRPWCDRLRFYPLPSEAPAPTGDRLRLQSVDAQRQLLEAPCREAKAEAEREALALWLPLQHELVDLALQAWSGPPPSHATDPEGRRLLDAKRQPLLAGGEPLPMPPAAWRAQAETTWRSAKARFEHHPHPLGPRSRRHPLGQLLALFEAWLRPEGLSPREAWRLRQRLASHRHRHGLPGEAQRARREAQVQTRLARPRLAQWRALLLARLAHLPGEEGLLEPEAWMGPLQAHEAQAIGLPEGQALHRSLLRRLRALREGPPEALAEAGALPSLDALARALPPWVGEVAPFPAPLTGLHAQLHAAFSRRRSLLLLHLEHQVRLQELPWVAALAPWRAEALAQAEASSRLRRLALLAWRHFPHRAWPNPFLSQLKALSQVAGLQLPWPEELAADIFMGQFTPKFAQAAQATGRLLANTPYGRYAGLPQAHLLALQADAQAHGRATSEGFLALAQWLNRGEGPQWGHPRRNAQLLECATWLHTQGQAALVEALGLEAELATGAGEHLLRWSQAVNLIAHAKAKTPQLATMRHRQLAVALRQGLFLLSFSPQEAVEAWLPWWLQAGRTHPPAAQAALAPLWTAVAWAWRPKGGHPGLFMAWRSPDDHQKPPPPPPWPPGGLPAA